MNALVLKEPRHPFPPGSSLDVAWRIRCIDGHHDMVWGNIRNRAVLPALLDDIERRFGQRPNVIDEAGD